MNNGRGEPIMANVMAGAEGERVIRWMEEGRTVFESVHRLLHECTQFRGVAEAAQKECERLQRNCEELREEVRLLKAETERLQREQTEAAQWFTAMMKEAASHLRIEPPPA
jgi:predicted RNase H-like nuclease (RuvC/YqgF family)